MYILHLIILIIFLILLFICISMRIPEGLKKESMYLWPFFKLAAGSLKAKNRILKNRSDRGAAYLLRQERKKELLMLNPAGNGDNLLLEYEIKRLANSILVIFIVNILAFLLCISSMTKSPDINNGEAIRNNYGEGEKNIKVDIYADDELIIKDEDITISERQYTEEEVSELFLEVKEKLMELVLGDNDNASVVIYDLKLVDSVEGYPVSIRWELSDYTVMDRTGHISQEYASDTGTLVELKAILSYFGYEDTYSMNVNVYKMPKDNEQAFEARLRGEIERYEESTLSYEKSIFPTEVDGRKIEYKIPQDENSMLLLAAAIVVALILQKAGEKDLQKAIKKRDAELMMDYPQIISKLTLLLGAGMTIQGAFTKLAEDYKKRTENNETRFAYEEMLLTVRQIQGGVSEADAYVRFGNRCSLQKYVKLGALLSQNLKRGSQGLLETLEAEEKDAFEERKALARRLGEEAGTKLLAPMGMMLVIVMVIVVIPAFLSFSI